MKLILNVAPFETLFIFKYNGVLDMLIYRRVVFIISQKISYCSEIYRFKQIEKTLKKKLKMESRNSRYNKKKSTLVKNLLNEYL